LILLYFGFGTAIAGSTVPRGRTGGVLLHGTARHDGDDGNRSVRRKGKCGSGFVGRVGWLLGRTRRGWAGQLGCAGRKKRLGGLGHQAGFDPRGWNEKEICFLIF
jgi:hypothetical protein